MASLLVELRVPPPPSSLPYSANVKLTARPSALAARKSPTVLALVACLVYFLQFVCLIIIDFLGSLIHFMDNLLCLISLPMLGCVNKSQPVSKHKTNTLLHLKDFKDISCKLKFSEDHAMTSLIQHQAMISGPISEYDVYLNTPNEATDPGLMYRSTICVFVQSTEYRYTGIQVYRYTGITSHHN